jgi:serine/threonine protein kinase
MSIAPSEFWSRLIQSGLADRSNCQRYEEEFSGTGGGSVEMDGQKLAEFLVSLDVLTEFQAIKLLESADPVLRVGSFVMTGDQPITPFAHWMPVQTVPADPSQPSQRGFLLRVPLAGLDEAIRSWLAAHSEVRCETLQPIELSGGAQSEGEDQMVEIFSPMPVGASLWRVLKSKSKLSPRKTVRLGVDLANALQALHAPAPSGLIIAHGAVGADHVWVTPKGHGILLRDPSSPARSPRADLSTSWIQRIDSPALYAAPELSDPAAHPTPSSDIYSLGCLLFSVIVGRHAFSGEDDRELFAAHNEDLPSELLQAVERGASGDPILRVLAYAMAKDPAARFESAGALAEALSRAGDLVEGKDVSIKKEGAQTSAKSRQQKPGAASRTETKPTSVDERTPSSAKPPRSPRSPAQATSRAKVVPNDRSTRSDVSSDPGTDSTPGPVTQSSSCATPAIAPSVTPSAEQESGGRGPDSSATPLRKRRKRNKNRIPILAGMMVLPLLMLGLAVALRGRGSQPRTVKNRPTLGVVKNVPKVPESRREIPTDDGPKLVNGYEVVASDRLLWVPPFSADSPPPPLTLLPPGPAAIVSIPIARVMENDDARPFMRAFRIELETLVAMAEKRAGVDRGQIARCSIALFPGKNGWPESALAVELKESVELKTLIDRWGVFESRADGATLYAGEDSDGDAYFIAGGDKGKLAEGAAVDRFAVGALKRIREVAESEGGSIPLVRSMQTLWDQTSSESDFVALVTPNFLFADGRQMLASTMPEFQAALKQWLIPNVAATTLSLSAKDSVFYAELRELPSGGATSASLLKSFRESVDQWPAWAESFLVESVQDPSWRTLAVRLPLMIRFVKQQTRSTVLGETVVASMYLPADGGAQVALATLLAMNTGRDGERVAQQPMEKPLTVEEMLERPMSISFLQLSLQFAVDAVVDEFKQTLPEGSMMPNVRIVGGDLEKNGITQNQQIRGFERDGQPLRKILTELVLGANPDKTAVGPSDPKQSLVWVVHPAGKSPQDTEILITTRDAAAGQYELPIEFQVTPP